MCYSGTCSFEGYMGECKLVGIMSGLYTPVLPKDKIIRAICKEYNISPCYLGGFVGCIECPEDALDKHFWKRSIKANKEFRKRLKRARRRGELRW